MIPPDGSFEDRVNFRLNTIESDLAAAEIASSRQIRDLKKEIEDIGGRNEVNSDFSHSEAMNKLELQVQTLNDYVASLEVGGKASAVSGDELLERVMFLEAEKSITVDDVSRDAFNGIRDKMREQVIEVNKRVTALE